MDQIALFRDVDDRPAGIESPSETIDASRMPTTFPDDAASATPWTRSTPTACGYDDAKLRAALSFLESHCGDDGLSQTMLIHRGRVFFAGDDIDAVHNIWSCTKSFTSTALGLLIEEGKCTLDTLAADVEPSLGPLYGGVRLRDFATMTSGYSAVGRSRWDDENSDWSSTPYQPETPHFRPGERFEYWDEAQMMLGRVLTRIAGEPLVEYLDRRLFQPIGMGPVSWLTEGEVDGIAINNGCTNLHLSASQLARFGVLMASGGRWRDQNVIPSAWIDAATSTQVEPEVPIHPGDRSHVRGSGSYGFNWWTAGGPSGLPLSPPRTFYASGLRHNVLCVVPEWDLVIVRMGTDGNPEYGKHRVYNEFINRLGMARMER